MSNPDPRNPPWNPYEKLELLTEILKAANVSPEALIPIIRSLQPPFSHWNDLALPRGRTLRQSQDIYYQMIQQQPAPHLLGLTAAGSVREASRPVESQLGKRPYTSEGPPSVTSLAAQFPPIQPKPPGLPATQGVNERSPGEPPKKKRGRPPKAETEARREQARARGEPSYSGAKRSSIPSLAMAGASSAMAAASSTWPSAQARPAGPGPGAVLPPSRPLSVVQPPIPMRTPPPPDTKPSSDPGSSGKRRRGRQRAEAASRVPEEAPQIAAPIPQMTPSRAYPDILSRDPEEGPSTFRAPRGQ